MAACRYTEDTGQVLEPEDIGGSSVLQLLDGPSFAERMCDVGSGVLFLLISVCVGLEPQVGKVDS